MNENLVGYLLNALDEDCRRDVEAYLSEHPEGHKYLEMLQQALEPLAADNDRIEPPPGLWVRTLGTVAEHQCRKLTPAPVTPALRSPAATRIWWRRADVAVAAALLLCASLLAVPGISYLRDIANRTKCANNLHQFYIALKNYSGTHNGRFPKIEEHAPAGMFVPILNDAGVLPETVTVSCPANGNRKPDLRSVKELDALTGEERKTAIRKLAGCYSYSLGYRDGAELHGLRADDGDDLPIMSDRPLLPEEGAGAARDNSPNHRGGQNVLRVGGDVKFVTTRYAGRNGDDIFLNEENQPRAGLGIWDSVLGASSDEP